MKIALNTLYYSLIGAAGLIGLVFAVSLMPIPGNIEIKVVKSGSMEPAIRVGSVVVIKPAESYSVGDVITFGKDTKTQIPTTHRIVGVQGEGKNISFTTKGDANDTSDNTTTALRDVKGKMLLTVPYMGYALAFLRTKLGFMLLVGVPALLVFLEEGRVFFLEMRKLLRRRRQRTLVPSEARVEVALQEHTPEHARRVVSDIQPKKIAMLVTAAITVIGCATLGSAYGNTLAYYSNSATSQGNVLRAAENFNIPVAAVIFSITTAVSDVVMDEVEEAPSQEESEEQTVEEVKEEAPPEASEAPPIEVTTSEVVLSE